jgi:hypothetical protein
MDSPPSAPTSSPDGAWRVWQLTSTADKLARACVEAARDGADFPTVCHKILKGHPFVAGVPIQRLDGEAILLEIPLITGQRIVFGPNSKDYSVSAGKGARAVI